MSEQKGASPHVADDAEERLALKSNRFGAWVLKWRLWIIVVSVVLSFACGAGAVFLKFNPDTRSFFGPKNPDRIALDHMEAKYTEVSNVLIVLTPKDGKIFTPPFLNLLADITKKAWRVPYTFRVDSVANFQELSAEGEDLKITPLMPKGGISTAEEAARIQEKAVTNDEIVNRLVSPKGDVTAVAIYVSRPHERREEVREIADFARGIVAEIKAAHPDLDVRLSGGIMADLAFAEAGQRDTKLLVPLMAAVILGVLLIGMRSGTVTLVTSVVIGLTVIATMGIFGWMGTVLNTVTAAAPPVIMTLFFADCVHFVMAAVQQQTHGRTREQSITEAIRLHVVPILIKSGTTIIGFLSLNFSDSPPLNQLGNIVSVGSVIGAVLTLTMIPAMLLYLPIPSYSEHGRTHKFLERMSDWIVARNRSFLIGFAVLFPLLLALIPRLEADDNFIHYFDTSFAFRADTDYMEQRLTGLHGLIYSVPAGGPEQVTDPAYLRKLDEFAKWYREQPNVAHVSTLADIVRRLNKAMNHDDPKFDTIPDDKKLIAQYLMLYELSLPPGQDLNMTVDVGRSESMVTVRLSDVSSKRIIALANAGQDWLRANAQKNETRATGLSVVYSYLTQRNIEAMMLGTAVSVLLVSLIMGYALSNWRLGIISLVVNLAPAGMAFGLWAIIGADVNLAISVVTSITYGIVTDDTVHTMTKYRWARQVLGMTPPDAARETLTYTGSAVILSSVALALGFALLGFSSFNITSVMGILSALIISLAAVAELLLLPGLLIMFDKDKV